MTEGPYKLPEGWRWVRLGEVFDLQQGASMSPQRRSGLNPRPFLRTKNIRWGTVEVSDLDEMDFSDAEVEKLKLQTGDLLVCEGGDVGRTAIWEGQLPLALYQNHIHRLRAKDTSVEPRFIMYWMQAAYQVFLAYQGAESRTAIPNLSGRRLKEFLVPLPPLAEQRRIAARVNELMERIREARRLRAQAREDAERLWQSVLADTFPRPGSDLPSGWRWVRLGEVCDILDRLRKPVKKKDRIPGDIPYCGANGIIDYVDGFTHEGEYVLLAEDGGFYGPGAPSAYVMEGRFWANNHVHIIRGKNGLLLNQLLRSYLVATDLKPFLTGATRPKLTQRAMFSIPIPLPPLAEQRRIVAHLEAVQEKIGALKAAQAETDEHFKRLEQSILEKAFRGEL